MLSQMRHGVHLHVVMRIVPRKVAKWSDREVVMRWRRLYPAGRDAEGRVMEPTKDQMSTWLADWETLALWRERLGDLSWFMSSLNESLARRANKEDGCKGRFWEGRFKSQVLCDAGAVMACMAYVDLNCHHSVQTALNAIPSSGNRLIDALPVQRVRSVRAGLADTPEVSEFTSIRERFENECAARSQSAKVESGSLDLKEPSQQYAATCLTPVEDIVADEEFGRWGVTLAEYLELVDVTGRMINESKRGAIPSHLAPLLTRLELRAVTWVGSVEGYGSIFQQVAGRRDRLVKMAKEAGRKWFCRGSGARGFYVTDPPDRRVAKVSGY